MKVFVAGLVCGFSLVVALVVAMTVYRHAETLPWGMALWIGGSLFLGFPLAIVGFGILAVEILEGKHHRS